MSEISYKVQIAVFDKTDDGWKFIRNQTEFVSIEEECGGCGHSEGEIWEATHDQFRLNHSDGSDDFIFLDFEVEYDESLDDEGNEGGYSSSPGYSEACGVWD